MNGIRGAWRERHSRGLISGLLRRLGVPALLTVLAALATASTSAQAATLVSNTSQAGNFGSPLFMAQSFTTGSQSATLTDIQLRLGNIGTGVASVKLRKNNNGAPGTLMATLTNPSSLSANQLNTFTAPANTTLDANTIYWVSVAEQGETLATLTHLFPLLADGDGFRSRLFLTNVAAPDNRCALELRGTELTAARFDGAAGVTDNDFRRLLLTLGPGRPRVRHHNALIGKRTSFHCYFCLTLLVQAIKICAFFGQANLNRSIPPRSSLKRFPEIDAGEDF